MPICLSRLLPISQSLRHPKLHSEFIVPYLRDATLVSAAGTRCFSKCGATRWRRFGKTSKQTLSKKKRVDNRNNPQAPLPSRDRMTDLAKWTEALEPLLLPHLRASSYNGSCDTLSTQDKCAKITQIIAEARRNDGGVDVLAQLGIKHGRWFAVLSVMESLIAHAYPPATMVSLSQLPSNLNWPDSTTKEMDLSPIEVDETSCRDGTGSARRDEVHFDPRYADVMATEKYTAIEQIWMSLGSIIIEAADLPPLQLSQTMQYVYQIIARLHNSGFVPENVYAHGYSGYETAVRRPPIMHLLYSRILATLSDAVWGAQQDELIAQAASEGRSFRDLGRNTPGGRFRLKVRELGPEVWLEFVLWCCVDSGLTTAGSWIVERMRTRNTKSPWFASQWTSAPGDGGEDEALLDWARVKSRHGGTVGHREGYSREQPFEVMKSRTISVGVVLALVEASINDRSPDIAGRGCTHALPLRSIERLLSFLEPHSLPEKYFDYLTVRLFQPLWFDFETDPTELYNLAESIRHMRSLESTHKPAQSLPSLDLKSVLEHSEVYAGVLHQVLESHAVAGRVHLSVEIFSQIQDLVDRSKLRAIELFLHSPQRPGQSLSSSPGFPFSEEYTSSHGQLPAQKLAPFLDLVTEVGMTDLGQWLLYSMDVDGPLIPLDLYSQSSLSPSLLRFAAATQDHILVKDVADAVSSRRPDVSYMRSFADAKLRLREFENAGDAFEALGAATGGGNSISNIASIIAMILRIEHSAKHTWKERRPRLLSPPLSLLDRVLGGDFQGIAGDWKREHRKDYRRGLACLLRIVEAIPGTVLSGVARSWIPRLGGGNMVGLRPQVFDIIISAIVETKGARVGMMLWDLFCELPAQVGEETQGWVNKADIKLVSTRHGLVFQPEDSPLPGSRVWSQKRVLPIRIERSTANTANAANAAEFGLNTDRNSDDAIVARQDGNRTPDDRSNGGISTANAEVEEPGINIDEPTLASTSRAEYGDKKPNPAQGDILSAVGEECRPPSPQDPPRAEISLGPDKFQGMISKDSLYFSSTDDEVAPLTSSPHNPSPVVRPTFRTLRIIIRAALQELETAKKLWYTEDVEVPINISEMPSKANMRVLEAAMTEIALVERWVKPLFRKFGLSNEDVAVEFGWKLGGEDSIFSIEDLEKRYAAARTEYRMAKEGLLADLSEVNIQKRFLGPPIRFPKVDVKKYTLRELAFFGPKLTESQSPA